VRYRTGRYAVIGCRLKQNANDGCNSCANCAGLVLCFIASFIVVVIAPLTWLVQEEVIHPSKYAVTRLGYLRGADLSSNRTGGREGAPARSRRSTRRRSSIAGFGRQAGRRRRSSTLGAGGTGRRKSVGAGGVRGDAGGQKQDGQKNRRSRGQGIGQAMQVFVMFVFALR